MRPTKDQPTELDLREVGSGLQTIAAACLDLSRIVLDVETEDLIKTIHGHADAVRVLQHQLRHAAIRLEELKS